jgi:hypothetical protein
MYISRHNIANLYEARLIREMDERIIDYLNENKEDLPFGNIFGDNLRIYIPIYSDPTAKEILETLKRIKDYGGLDLDKGEVVRKIKLDPKFGGGEKEQRMNIGSAISKLKISDEDKNKYLDWLARYKDNIRTSLGESKYGVIISRAPVDVIRMSDHSRITSCHSATGDYFHCAVQEAINGGAIAYVIVNDDLNTFLDEGYTIQDDEIFEDDERHSYGIVPVSRLRIRRLLSSDEAQEMGIPDSRIYGNSTIPGFYDTVKNFLREKQPMGGEEFAVTDWEKRGGSYYDNDIDDLLHGYFGEDYVDSDLVITHNKGDKSIESSRQQDINEFMNTLDADCDEIKRAANNRLQYCNVDYNIDNDEQPYVMPYAGGSYSFRFMNNEVLNDIDFDIEEESQFRQTLRGNFDDEITWSRFFEWLFEERGVSLYKFEISNGEMEFTFNSEDVFFNSDEYDRYVDDIIDFDRYLNQIDDDEWKEIFEEIGIGIQSDTSALDYMIANTSVEEMSYDDSRGDRHVEWPITIDAITGETYSTYTDPTSFNDIPNIRDRSFIGDEFAKMIDNYIRVNYKLPVSRDHQQSFNNFFESYYQPIMKGDNALQQYNVDSLQINVVPETETNHRTDMKKSESIIFSIRLNVEAFDNENVGLILFLNQNLDDLKNMARFAYLSQNRYITTGSSRYKNLFHNLKRVYGKYAI